MTYLSPQISHLVAARPMSVTMGNAIRQLKLDISGSDIDLPEQDVRPSFCVSCFCTLTDQSITLHQAKDALFQKIDTYIRERIIIADQVIQETAGNKIKDGDVILTYARSVPQSSRRQFFLSCIPQIVSGGEGLARGSRFRPLILSHHRRFKTDARGYILSILFRIGD